MFEPKFYTLKKKRELLVISLALQGKRIKDEERKKMKEKQLVDK